MKSVLFVLTLVSFNLFSQNIPKKLPLAITLTNGIDFIQNDSIVSVYNTRTKYFFGIGIESRSKKIENPRLSFQYTYSSIQKNDTIFLNQNSLFLGGIFPLYTGPNTTLFSRFGCSAIGNIGFNSSSLFNSFGIEMGLGVERKLMDNFNMFFELAYNYQHIATVRTKNLDLLKLAFGLKFGL